MKKAQRIQIAQQLIKIAPEVTALDRSLCSQELNVSKVTISYYLCGKVTNNDRALRLLEFFQGRINQRQLEIQSICKNN